MDARQVHRTPFSIVPAQVAWSDASHPGRRGDAFSRIRIVSPHPATSPPEAARPDPLRRPLAGSSPTTSIPRSNAIMSEQTPKHKSRRFRRFIRANKAVSALECGFLRT